MGTGARSRVRGLVGEAGGKGNGNQVLVQLRRASHGHVDLKCHGLSYSYRCEGRAREGYSADKSAYIVCDSVVCDSSNSPNTAELIPLQYAQQQVHMQQRTYRTK